MKLSIEKNLLVNALQVITPLTDKSSSKPILSNFLLEAKLKEGGGVVKLSATDYEISISGEFPAKVEEPGVACISARKVLEVCREFSSEEVRISSDEQLWVTLEGGPSRLRLPSVEVGLYPHMDPPELPNRFTMNSRELRQCIELTTFAAMTNETRKNLMGVCLRLSNGNSTQWVATDGHRLAQVTREAKDVQGESPPEIIVPRKAMMEMLRVLEHHDEAVEVSFDERHLLMTAGKTLLMTRLIEGKFPNVEQVIPKDSDRTVLVNRERMINALKIVSFMSQDKIKPVKMTLEPDLLRLESERAEFGDVLDELPVEYAGENMKIGFNARYLLDVFSVIQQSPEVKMKLKGSLNPCLIEIPNDSGFLSVVMPLRIEW
ncbi:MAG: DNA polymerase III subunit beta [SAR324 cluster bacterium]|nr:DNA polymerase III subunit beta [SAR324 cluster bacterium]MCH8885762.1 DNA polymerase III subunit beta [SAR324 cluster bacterium]